MKKIFDSWTISRTATIIVILLGLISTSCTNREKIYNERLDEAANLYKKLCQAITIINNNNDIYRQTSSSTIDNGTFSEDGDEAAFNHMFKVIDTELNAININKLCDSISQGDLTRIEKFDKWPNNIKKKAQALENLISNLRTVGYKVGNFNNRSQRWKNEPWFSANSPYYHQLPIMENLTKEIDEIGLKLDKQMPGLYIPILQETDNAEEIENEAIKIFDTKRDKAIELFTTAAEHGRSHSMYCLGIIAEENDDIIAAHKWNKKAAIYGSTKAMIELAKGYFDPLNPNHKNKPNSDRQLAKKWYMRAANWGNTEGIYNMALYYHLGLLDDRNDEIAQNYCKIGIILHNSSCANLMGIMQKDKAEQAKYFHAALKLDPNNISARTNLRQLGYSE